MNVCIPRSPRRPRDLTKGLDVLRDPSHPLGMTACANKRSVQLFVAVVCFLLCSSCRPLESDAEKGRRLQILHKGNGPEVQDLDPHLVNSVASLNVISALLEGLVAEDPHDLHPVPGVAETWEISPDQRIYTFHLRHNAKWSNGDAVTARD